MKRLPLLVLLIATLPAACGYFNSFYNAQRSFAEAERAAQRGESAVAGSAYRTAIEKAAISYRNHPDSRWADDALLLVGRSRFAVGEHDAARAALLRVREQSGDAQLRAVAALYLGAALVALGQPDSALAPLAEGLAADLDARQHAFGLFWQGRARLATGDGAGWADLEAVAQRDDPLAVEAALELGRRGVQHGDTARTLHALDRALALRGAQARVDSVLVVLGSAELRFGPALLLPHVERAEPPGWSPEARTRLAIRAARLRAATGDTAGALRRLDDALQGVTGVVGGDGRQLAARWRLARLDDAAELAEVRALLLPGIPHTGVVAEIRRLRTVETLLQRARGGQAAALFAAAELARDTLAAPHLARALFLAYADVAAGSVWAPKALLAALALTPDSARAPLLERVRATPDNPYVAATLGRTDTAAFAAAEDRLGRAVAALRADAAAEALSGDLRVAAALTTLDSLRLSALNDSLVIRCGGMLDSLALRGVRADSVRAACLRADSTAVARYLVLDSLQLRQPQKPAADTAARTGRVSRDTLLP